MKRGSQQDRTIRFHRDDLLEMADLRNAITHRYRRDEPIASPYLTTVELMETIKDDLLSPPRIGPRFSREVQVCTPDEPIGIVSRRMLSQNLSQVPVYRDSRFQGLLTTDTIARWLAARLEGGIGIIDEEPVEKVLKFAESRKDCEFLAPDDTVFDAIALFDDASHHGKRLNAILITRQRDRHSPPQGIITIFDMPELQKAGHVISKD